MTFHIYKEGNCCVDHIVSISIMSLVSLGGITCKILLRMIFIVINYVYHCIVLLMLISAIVNYVTLFFFIKVLSHGGKILMSQSVIT